MGIFPKLLKRDPLHEQAAKLVPAANVMAVSTFVPLLDEHPILREAEVEAWDFFATAGAVFVAINNLKRVVDRQRFKDIYAIVLPNLHKWHARGEDAILDCQKFVARTVASGASDQDALGFWILRNALGREPAENEAMVGRTIGGLLSAPLKDWWCE